MISTDYAESNSYPPRADIRKKKKKKKTIRKQKKISESQKTKMEKNKNLK